MTDTKHDNAISRGFDRGNYANAYETQDYETALAKLSPNRSPEYVAAFTLGFFGSYERSEMGSGMEAFDDAYALVAERAIALGIAVEREEEEEESELAGDG